MLPIVFVRALSRRLRGGFEPTHGYLRRSVERAVYRRLGVHFYEEAISYTRNDSMVLYSAASIFCMNKKTEALDALTKAWRAGAKDADWARRDPDLTILRGDPAFERLYPEKSEGS